MGRVIVAGGGIAGLAAAERLAAEGHRVLLLEKESYLGGLAASFKLDGVWLERYYHHIFKGDRPILETIERCGLSAALRWYESRVGFFCGGRVYRFATPGDLLRFAPLPLADRIRFGLSTLYFVKKKDWSALEDVSVKDWVIRWVGRKAYEVVWQPLLRLKFGEEHEKVAAAWLWGRIHPRAKSRSKGMQKEELGYLDGGFQRLVDALEERLLAAGGELHRNTPVERIVIRDGRARGVVVAGEELAADAVLAAVPTPVLRQLAPDLPAKLDRLLAGIRYQGVVCLILTMDRSLTDIYWLNVSDASVPFGGVIEHTNLVPASAYGGRHVYYIFNYTPADSPLFAASADELLQRYEPSLARISPAYSRAGVQSRFVFRDPYATPLYDLGFSRRKPPARTELAGLYIADTAQIYPDDRNMSNSILTGLTAVDAIRADLGRS